jgi:hypothetical protein
MRDTIVRHWSVSSRRPHPADRDPPGSDGAPRFPAPRGVGLRTEVRERLPVGAREVPRRRTTASGRDTVSRHRSDDQQTTHPSAPVFRREGAPAAGGFRLGARRPRDIHHPHWVQRLHTERSSASQRRIAARAERDHRSASPGSANPMSPPNPRDLVRRTSGCPPCRHGRRHTTHTAPHRRGAPRRGTIELRPKPQPSHVAPWNVRQRDSAQTRCS